ncbi:MAG TPA: class I SAM-dependent methyltransferase [Pirellulales bacterium]|nr:class I SAM-dependent methyltransferase [Pirellulales bacterium]
MFRAAECRHLACLPLLRPVLDLGVGDGMFARAALRIPLDIGVDLRLHQLRAAARNGAHRALAQGDASRLPFRDASMGTVLAVSVCEHLAEPRRSLREVCRVLRPGGMFVATIVLPCLGKSMLYPSLCRNCGAEFIGRTYVRLLDYLFEHHAMHSRAHWEEMTESAGLSITDSKTVISPVLSRWFDFWLLTAWPYKLFGPGRRRLLGWPSWSTAALWRWLSAVESRDADDGGVLYLIAHKPDLRRTE